FEFKSINDVVLKSDIIGFNLKNGVALCYVEVLGDPLRSMKPITDGEGTLIIAGKLQEKSNTTNRIPRKFKGAVNYRCTFPLIIVKDLPNQSPILFKSIENIQASSSFSESILADSDSNQYNRSYIHVSASHLETYGGRVDKVELSYQEQRSKTNEYKIISIFPLKTYNEPASASLKFTQIPSLDAQITLTSTDGTEKTYVASSSGNNIQGEIHPLSSSFVLFETGSSIVNSARNLHTAITSSNGHVNRVIGPSPVGSPILAYLKLTQDVVGEAGNTAISYNDIMTSSITGAPTTFIDGFGPTADNKTVFEYENETLGGFNPISFIEKLPMPRDIRRNG
ncbi:unnamed protein product, partial [marine sediment metagenome]